MLFIFFQPSCVPINLQCIPRTFDKNCKGSLTHHQLLYPSDLLYIAYRKCKKKKKKKRKERKKERKKEKKRVPVNPKLTIKTFIQILDMICTLCYVNFLNYYSSFSGLPYRSDGEDNIQVFDFCTFHRINRGLSSTKAVGGV